MASPARPVEAGGVGIRLVMPPVNFEKAGTLGMFRNQLKDIERTGKTIHPSFLRYTTLHALTRIMPDVGQEEILKKLEIALKGTALDNMNIRHEDAEAALGMLQKQITKK